MNITSLMVAFLLQLHSENKLNIRIASQTQDSELAKKQLVNQWVDENEWNLYLCMDEALDEFMRLEYERRH